MWRGTSTGGRRGRALPLGRVTARSVRCSGAALGQQQYTVQPLSLESVLTCTRSDRLQLRDLYRDSASGRAGSGQWRALLGRGVTADNPPEWACRLTALRDTVRPLTEGITYQSHQPRAAGRWKGIPMPLICSPHDSNRDYDNITESQKIKEPRRLTSNKPYSSAHRDGIRMCVYRVTRGTDGRA